MESSSGTSEVGMYGDQLLRASSMAAVVVSNSVRSTVVFNVFPDAVASASSCRAGRRCDIRWIMGQRSVAIPSRVSTAERGFEGGLGGRVGEEREGGRGDRGEEPKERAAITS